MLAQRPTPCCIAELSGQTGRTDDVGEEDRREHPVGLEQRADAGQEALDLRHDRVLVARPDEVVDAGQFDQRRSGDLAGEIAPVVDGETRGLRAVAVEAAGPRRSGRLPSGGSRCIPGADVATSGTAPVLGTVGCQSSLPVGDSCGSRVAAFPV
jgi:hypothetical protein